ncbi:hypothetical protein FTX61_12125 [Nitriliruptoraceae bacterium ZYF776]|nr:hypothetical protein [Profundirhabdus halotolerans]
MRAGGGHARDITSDRAPRTPDHGGRWARPPHDTRAGRGDPAETTSGPLPGGQRGWDRGADPGPRSGTCRPSDRCTSPWLDRRGATSRDGRADGPHEARR